MQIGVVGVGTVGSVVADSLENLSHNVLRHDPEKGYIDNPESRVIFVCVWDSGNMDNVKAVVDKWAPKCELLVIKTTLMPGTTDYLIERYGAVCYWPEFLSESTAKEDFECPDKNIIGSHVYVPLLEELIEPYGSITYMKPVEAEILKLSLNTHHAIKVTFANEVADLCEKYGADYGQVRKGMELDRFVTPNHLDVDHGGYRGFGGKCLPKDAGFLVRAGLKKGYLPNLTATAQRLNDLRRNNNVQ